MIDINYLEANLQKVTEKLNQRGKDYTNDLKQLVDLNIKRKSILMTVEKIKAEKNGYAKQVGLLMQQNKVDEVEALKNKSSKLNDQINKMDEEVEIISSEIKNKISFIPNITHENIPVGKDEDNNVEIKRWGDDLKKTSTTPHWDIATKLDLVDFESGVKLSGSRFLIYKNKGSKMLRAISDILLSHHSDRGYSEYHVPFIVNEDIMYGTGQLPKFSEDAYSTGMQYLIPTAEVPLTNMVKNKIFEADMLPLKMTSYTQCFRQEAGSAGRDTKGMIRLHQFSKVELVKIVNPNSSFEELETLVQDAESILELFQLPYRRIELCSGDIGFSSAKTYDLEVWFPYENKYREISSCSNCTDFQARRISAKVRTDKGSEYVHTLNGSGVAIDRLMAAIFENYWDGEKLILPKVLVPYFSGETFLK